MASHLSQFLTETVERELPNLRALDEAAASVPRGAGKWSPKEEIGHLIDSASNNHVRFGGATTRGEFRGPTYAQNEWVRLHDYRSMNWESLVTFWHQYNRLIATLAGNIPEDRLETPCIIGDHAPVTLAFLIEDYVWHMQHHLDLLLRREKITSYPGAGI